MSIDWDIEELAGYAIGKCETEVDEMINNSTVDDELYERYNVDLDQYIKIVRDLLPFTMPATAALTKTSFNCFVTEGRMIVKQEVKG